MTCKGAKPKFRVCPEGPSVSLFDNIHQGLTQQEALRILEKPLEDLESASDYYMAASHLINFPGDTTEKALLQLLAIESTQQPFRLAQRKAVEVLGRLKAHQAIEAIGCCLMSDDPYLVENSAWALQQLGCVDSLLHQVMIDRLADPAQNRRVLIQSLAGLKVHSALAAIEPLQNDSDPGVRGAALCAIALLSDKRDQLLALEDHLTLANQMDRQSAIQDVIDAGAINLLPSVLQAPVSPVFRMRALKALWPESAMSCQDMVLTDALDALMRDDPSSLVLVHRYDDEPDNSFLIQEFFGTDFSRCYLALQTLRQRSTEDLWPLLRQGWVEDAHNDYGAHYFFIRLFGSFKQWPIEAMAMISGWLVEAVDNQRPQFIKSKAAALLALASIYPLLCKQHLSRWKDAECTPWWECRYAAAMAQELIDSGEDYKAMNGKEMHPYVLARLQLLPFIKN
jgi:bilin biosynthesis protein